MDQIANAEPNVPATEMVNIEEARRMFGVSQWTWQRWAREGKLPAGESIGPSGRYKQFRVDELRRAIGALRQPEAFPPPGMIDEARARETFGVGTWTWDKWRKQGELRCGRWFRLPNGGSGRTKLYPIEELRRVIDALRGGPFPPAGFVDRDGAARMFGVSPFTFKAWVVQGKVSCGRPTAIPGGGQCYLYAVEDLERLKDVIKPEGQPYPDTATPGRYVVPEGLVTRRTAWRMFGVDRDTWKRWEREGRITCGWQVNRGAPRVYRVADLERLVAEYGRYSPPYPDPDRAGCYRVPLSGHDIRRREAIIDAADLRLVAGRRWHYSGHSGGARAGFGRVMLSQRDTDGNAARHRILLGVTEAELDVMHRNGDPLDCRRENLVVRTHSEKGAAARKRESVNGRPCTSGFKGVSWDKSKGKWVVQVKRDGKRFLGRFDDELAAAQAYDEAARETWGEHARLNFPDGVDAWLEAQALRTERAEAA
jgi:predicted site-specific integrase-resolvase